MTFSTRLSRKPKTDPSWSLNAKHLIAGNDCQVNHAVVAQTVRFTLVRIHHLLFAK